MFFISDSQIRQLTRLGIAGIGDQSARVGVEETGGGEDKNAMRADRQRIRHTASSGSGGRCGAGRPVVGLS